MRRVVGILIACLLAAVQVGLLAGVAAAAPPSEPCDLGDYCAEEGLELSDPPSVPRVGQPGRGSPDEERRSAQPDQPAASQAPPPCTSANDCSRPLADGIPLTPVGGAPGPEAVVQQIRVRLVGTLPVPVLSSDPAAGVAAIVRRPTFVRVENWTGTVHDQECVLLLCVSVTAVPSLTFAPGDPDEPAIRCDGAGSRFDPSGPRAEVQAGQPGACSHAYERRTGVPGRPSEWPGVVTVTWDLTWSSSLGGSGTLEPVSKSADLPRAVHEVQVVLR